MIALLVMTDGRDHIFQTIPSAEAFLDGPISEKWIQDDSGDPSNAARLRRVFPSWRVVSTAGRSGFGGAIRSAWSTLLAESSAPFVFHLEDDFTFPRLIEVDRMASVLLREKYLAQLALRRQPWNAEELAAGGIVELHPDDFIAAADEHGNEWLEHRRFFTTNPGLYRRELMERGWPTGEQSEGRFSLQLFEDPGARSGYWGSRDSGEWCHHIGHVRAGIGY